MKQTMPFSRERRGSVLLMAAAVCALAAGTTGAVGQSSFPVNPPTSLPAGNALPAPIAASGVARVPAHRAQVSFAAGMLDVQANNSSLNQILRDIARSTGMKITGAVGEQRVFGNYGPAKASTVLATLLDGAGVNMLLREGSGEAPVELVLTQRTGGPSPPDPNAGAYDEGPEEQAPVRMGQPPPPQGFPGQARPPRALVPPTSLPVTQQPTATQQAPPTALQQVPPTAQPSDSATANGISGTSGNAGTSGPQPIPATLNNVNGSSMNTSPTASTLPTTNSVPTDSVNTPVTTPPSSGIVDAPNPAAPGSTTAPASPNGVKTPDQIYQQLLQMQQQNKKPQS